MKHILVAILGISVALSTAASSSSAAGPSLTLTASPAIADVGGQVLFTLTSKHFPAGSTAILSFVSPHHGFTGRMPWTPACNCFRLAVALAKRIHPLEQGRAQVRLRHAGKVIGTAGTRFQIRGLAKNGRDFAPGGRVFLTGWVSNATPPQNESEHFCAWLKTVDNLGVTGYQVQFIVHFKKRTQRFSARVTSTTGVTCSDHSIGFAKSGYRVRVDIYAAGQHVQTSFTPHPAPA